MGVLPAPRRLENSYREYPPQALDRVMLVRRALTMSFTLAELARILKERDRGGAPCRQVRALAVEKLAQLERQIADAQLLRDQLKSTLKAWDKRLSSTPRGQPARLLDTLIGKAHHK
jgi:DNA-binding transcriptional MerR regulator